MRSPRVSSIRPGRVTGTPRASSCPAAAPLRRSGTADDVADVIVALATTSYVTGQIVVGRRRAHDRHLTRRGHRETHERHTPAASLGRMTSRSQRRCVRTPSSSCAHGGKQRPRTRDQESVDDSAGSRLMRPRGAPRSREPRRRRDSGEVRGGSGGVAALSSAYVLGRIEDAEVAR